MAPGMVPNPKYRELQELLRNLRRDADMVEHALDEPIKQMASRHVWVGDKGGAAVVFESELLDQHRRLRSAMRDLIASVEEALRRTPEEVPPLGAAFGAE
ncbi:hypothetical protein Acsp04_44920 [Actinomadura sp. NBRC 104425]|uniref:hypothetical protein n=1 Tax=Actinomadura sp. NBRC 104425 TaxID=3032204 RepID=UPI0024A0AFB8|nr:hypothetical protein [Actinomadura sp. NBRC 104425]GLZ14257.1 hypothetical protein Acsp04_44920 [Actinomadura sp. NBRC 104425]